MSPIHFATGLKVLKELAPWLPHHHGLTLFVGTATSLFALLLAGCSSSHPGLPGIYLMELSYQHAASEGSIGNSGLSSVFAPLVSDIELTVRTGYFGLCIRSTSKDWICNKDATILKNYITPAQDPLDLITISKLFKDNIVFSGLIFISLALGFLTILLLATFPGWHTETDEDGSEHDVKPFPSRVVINSILGFLAAAVLLGFVSSLWQHTAAVAAATTAQHMSYGTMKSNVGGAAMVLGWLSLALYVISLVGIVGQSLTMQILDRLTNE